MNKQKKEKMPVWVVWLFVWLCLFGLFTYMFLGPIQQSFKGELDTPLGLAKIIVENESEKVILSVVRGFFASIITAIVVFGIIKIYEIKKKKR